MTTVRSCEGDGIITLLARSCARRGSSRGSPLDRDYAESLAHDHDGGGRSPLRNDEAHGQHKIRTRVPYVWLPAWSRVVLRGTVACPPIPRGLPCPCSRSRSQRRRRSRGNRISPARRSTGRVGSLLARRYTVGADTRKTSATSSTVRYSCPPSRTSVLPSGWLRAAVPAVRGIFPRSVSGMQAPSTWRPLSRVRARGPARNLSST